MRRYIVRLIFYFTLLTSFLTAVYVISPGTILEEVIILISGSSLIIFLISIVEYNILWRPLKEISAAQRAFNAGNIKVRIAVLPYDLCARQLAQSFNATAERFEAAEEQRISFSSNVSHELRSPLTLMQGFLQAIVDGTIKPSERMKYIKIVANETKRLTRIVNSMLSLSRLDSGKEALTPSPFDINAVISSVALNFERKASSRGIILRTALTAHPCIVFADRERIEQVLMNLIENAINYSPNNKSVTIKAAVHIKKVYVSVIDQGYGIKKEDQPFIFDLFFTGNKARSSGGTGIGLAIVRKVLSEHREVVWVESAPKSGSTFTFTLTLLRMHYLRPLAAVRAL